MVIAVTPWRVFASKVYPEMYAVEGAYLVADNLPIEDANAIAAAPDLLKAAKEAYEWMNGLPIPTTGCTTKMSVLFDAIAKAERRT